MNHDPLHDLFERAAPPAASPADTSRTLDELRPDFQGALRRQRLRLGAAVTAVTVALAGGAAALGAIGGDSAAELDPTSPAPHTSIGDAEIVEEALEPPVDEPAPDAERSRTETVGPTPTTTAAGPADEDAPESDDDATEPDDDHDESSTTTSPPTTTAPDTGPFTGTTPGGAVTVTFDDGVITIESIDPAPGFTSDITDEDPQEVKVYFYGDGEEYEVEITVESGELVIEEERSDS